MKPRWLTVALMISLAFNLTFLGAAGYRLWTKQHRHERRIERYTIRPGMDMPPSFEPKHMEAFRERMKPRISPIRKRLFEERKSLSELMMAEKPDTVRINETIGRIGGLQVQIEKEIIYEMLKNEPAPGAPVRRHIKELFHERFGGMPGPGMMQDPGMMPPPEFQEYDSIPEHRPGR